MLLTILAVVTLQAMAQDTLQTEQPEKKMSWLRRTIRGFSYIDENYVELVSDASGHTYLRLLSPQYEWF